MDLFLKVFLVNISSCLSFMTNLKEKGAIYDTILGFIQWAIEQGFMLLYV